MPATASGGARPEEAASPSASSSAAYWMGTRPEELMARLAAGRFGSGGGGGAGVGGGEDGEYERVRTLREIKNQIIGNRTKKLQYLHLGAVPAVVAALAEPAASPAALVQAAAAAGSFACGVDDGVRAVLAAGAVAHLTRLLAHPDDKVIDASARALRMIYQSKLAPKFDVNNEKNMEFLLTLLNRENENVTDVELQKQALSTNAVQKLSDHLLANSLESTRAVTILLALAELCSKLEESRSQLMSVQASTLILDALKHACADIRVAACSCLKNISRSSKVLSAGRLSCDTFIAPLIQLLNDSSTSVQVAALGAICNIAVNLTPRKSILLHSGAVSQLVHLSKSMDPTLRLKSVWALRNIMFLLNPKDKDFILKELTLSTLSSLICDSEHVVQEQTLALVHNLVDGYVDSVNYVIGEDGMVINAISRQLNNASSPGVCIQGMLVLANVAAGGELNKEAVMNIIVPRRAERIKPSFVVNFLQSKDKQLRVATLWSILNLIYPKCEASSARVARLQNAGVISQVKGMINDPCLDCKLRVRMVLEHCLDNADDGFM
ncbi:hypothetical protein GUJ93_ZPchr0011g28718 [Zizania palustris]|uniref:Armadillo repeat-containing protein 8 n=1 Tax=Zizania palustris TaxID=103762 RepID=A0A8J6BTR5_ZIZPA|nr:hypothetical protein GUJ93_ZPchr0011g28718 [Zizania palustris]